MTDTAKLKKPRKISLIWLIPFLASIITAILIWNNTLNVGPTIRLLMPSAEGMEAGKTLVKFRSVVVGTVTDISLSEDYSETILTIEMKPQTEDLLRANSQFWVVKPRIENTSVSGLDTILSGSYIQMTRGDDENFADTFVCLDAQPVSLDKGAGRTIFLESAESKTLNVGDPVIYKGFHVGSITQVNLLGERDVIRYSAFIEEDYKNLVNDNTLFWLYNGMNFSLGTSGFDFHLDNLSNILQGGVVFENFSGYVNNEQSLNKDTYKLHQDNKAALLQPLYQLPQFVVMLTDDLRNIDVGSSVTYKGIKIGQVLEAPWYIEDVDVYKSGKYIPVLIAIDTTLQDRDFVLNQYHSLIDKASVCAYIDSTSLLASDNEIALTFSTKKCSSELKTFRDLAVIPSISGTSLTDKINEIMTKMEDLDLAAMSKDLAAAINKLYSLLDNLDKLSGDINENETADKIIDSLKRFDVTLQAVRDTVDAYNIDSKVYDNIEKTLNTMNSVIGEVEVLMDKVSRNPNSIIFGTDGRDPEIRVGGQ